jgi:hypothetical protein
MSQAAATTRALESFFALAWGAGRTRCAAPLRGACVRRQHSRREPQGGSDSRQQLWHSSSSNRAAAVGQRGLATASEVEVAVGGNVMKLAAAGSAALWRRRRLPQRAGAFRTRGQSRRTLRQSAGGGGGSVVTAAMGDAGAGPLRRLVRRVSMRCAAWPEALQANEQPRKCQVEARAP